MQPTPPRGPPPGRGSRPSTAQITGELPPEFLTVGTPLFLDSEEESKCEAKRETRYEDVPSPPPAGRRTDVAIEGKSRNRAHTPPFLAPGARASSANQMYALISPAFEAKLRSRWTGIRSAFLQIDSDHSGTISKEELWKLFTNMNLPISPDEFTKLFKYFDKDESGTISFEEFNNKLGNILHFKEEGGVGHTIAGKAAHAKSHHIPSLSSDVPWNNEFRQVLISRGSSRGGGAGQARDALIKRVVQGDYFLYKDSDTTNRWCNQENTITSVRRIRIMSQDWDDGRAQPMMSSLLSNAFTPPERESRSGVNRNGPPRSRQVQSKNFVRQNIQNMREHSPTKSQAGWNVSQDSRPSTSGGHMYSAATPVNAPRTLAELELMLGQRFDTATTTALLRLLRQSSKFERGEILRAAASAPPRKFTERLQRGLALGVKDMDWYARANRAGPAASWGFKTARQQRSGSDAHLPRLGVVDKDGAHRSGAVTAR